MVRSRWKLGVLLAAVAAVCFLAAREFPQFVAGYEAAARVHPYWGYAYLALCAVAAAAMLVLGLGLAWTLVLNSRAKQRQREAGSRNPSQMTAEEQQQELAQRLAETSRLADDTSLPPESRAPIRMSVDLLKHKLERQSLEIVAFGTVSSGKSSLLNVLAGREAFRTDPRGGTTISRAEVPWPGDDKVTLVDTPGLAEVDGATRENLARQVARDADLVLFVVDGPWKDFELRLVAQLAEMEKRVIVCLNKGDWFRPEDRAVLLGQLAQQAARFVRPEDVVAVQARPAMRLRVRVLPDGAEVQEPVEAEPDISAVAARMLEIVAHDGRELLLANLLLRSRGLVAEARQRIQSALDRQARDLVDRSMWQAGAAAMLSPLPALDVLAGLGVSTHMVLGLARVYRQPVDLETAGRLVTELGKNLVAILGTAAAAPAVATGVASLLKTVPGAGTLAGGLLQGLSQALVTRWIGAVFIEYFRNEMRTPDLGWASLARAKWQEVTRPGELAQLVKTGLGRLGKDDP